VAPQVVFHLSSKDSAGYSVIDSEKEYDLMARIAYTYTVAPKLDVYAEVLPGYSLVTYNKIVLGSQAPKAHGIVLGGGLGAAFAITERLFANASLGYQQGFQTSHGISDRDVSTKVLRIALGGGVKF
jgi:opacity protein-like surface antigen